MQERYSRYFIRLSMTLKYFDKGESEKQKKKKNQRSSFRWHLFISVSMLSLLLFTIRTHESTTS